MKIPDRIRFINKRYTNRLMGLIAGRRFSPIAMINHTGRKTGRWYATPIIVAEVEGGFVFALTYGDHVDWYRNIVAADSGRLIWRGETYAISRITKLTREEGRDHFPQPFRAMLKGMGTAGFFRMEISEAPKLPIGRQLNFD